MLRFHFLRCKDSGKIADFKNVTFEKIPSGVFVWQADLCKNLMRFLTFFGTNARFVAKRCIRSKNFQSVVERSRRYESNDVLHDPLRPKTKKFYLTRKSHFRVSVAFTVVFTLNMSYLIYSYSLHGAELQNSENSG